MLSKPEKNYFINIPLTIMATVCIITGFLLDFKFNAFNAKLLHIWSGYIMTGILALHFLMHVEWVANLTKTIFRNKMKVIAASAMLIVSLGICYSIVVFSPQGNAHGSEGEGRRSFQGQFDKSNQ
jgi:uncharacterized membrane protein